ncbi:OmpA family protein [Neorhizobium galegae]|uniref:OmpA family protein n=1 Tax=Neorhizobium galegae TaxID=399 RepID=UPI0006214499|nr:OmpA family protein [Neorhizobium galegae]MCQ1781112.1 OmpA family protein [Neorhizobium galegae]MCQ1797711.1 OmpA family protein [Neorhizobium galegae]CDZ30981.1 Outer membrane protein/peptidoglycan-associated (Lipo)protein [Neorhizobium galegae bv. officinalis]
MAVISEPAAKSEHKGYNRGLILGLTMAESMLLLVFCLLLVAAAIINSERKKVAEAVQELVNVRPLQEENRRLKEQLDDLQRSVDLLAGTSAEAEELQKEWRELVQARDTLRSYQELGLTPKAIAELRRVAEALKRAGIATVDIAALEQRLQQLISAETEQKSSKPHEWPPIINLSEAGGYFFRSGSAELTKAFADKLRGSIASEIAQSLDRYQVDIIEVIGHTDEQPISRTGSNLDQSIIDVVDGRKPITAIIPADNAGLGLARAIAVANVLRADRSLKDAAILPMSGGQLVMPGDVLTTGQAGNVESRRRIEIRIRRRAEPMTP